MKKTKYTIIVSPEYERYRPLLQQLATNDVPSSAQLIYRARNRVFTLTADDGTQLNIKAFRCPSFPNSAIYTHWRESKASRSYHNSRRLTELNIGTAIPVGYVEVSKNGMLTRSYYVSLQHPGETVRDWQNIPHSDNLIDALGALLVDMHRKGVWHKDFTPGNILFTRSDNGHYEFALLDVNRMKFDIHDTMTLMTNFKAIHLDDKQMLRLAHAYARHAGLDDSQVCNKALKTAEAYRHSKARHRIFKKIFKH